VGGNDRQADRPPPGTGYGRCRQDTPCGIRYLRANNGTPYQLSASVTWQITWQGSNGTGGDLPDGTFETTQDMNVQEIQSINR
jgi:predicted heme/steroid binding protein